MSIRRWISSGESEQFESCANEQELFNRLESEIESFKKKLGTLLFMDGRGDVFSVGIAFTLTLESARTIDDADVEIIASCEHCLSESINECGICFDCGHVNHCPPILPKKKVTSGRSH